MTENRTIYRKYCMDSVLFLLIAVTLHRLDILVHVGEARGLTEHNPSATECNESEGTPFILLPHLSASG